MHTRTHHDYKWGLDVSHTLEGAGCVGGLLMVRAPLATAVVATDSYSLPTEVPALDPYFPAAGATVYDTWFPTYDHNGNVNHLVREPTLLTPASTDPYGVPVPATYTTRLDATYEPTAGRQPGSLPFFRTWQYDAFGNILRATGPAAEWNPFTFSTKYLDRETGWSYYGYRYYDALRGRWPSRDPIGEEGGENLLGFVQNGPVSNYDYLGLDSPGCDFVSRERNRSSNSHCYKECCARHDRCYDVWKCRQASWVFLQTANPIRAAACQSCNVKAGACIAKCKFICGKEHDNPRARDYYDAVTNTFFDDPNDPRTENTTDPPKKVPSTPGAPPLRRR